MRKIKAVLGYDGTCYSGWQIQSNVATIQSVFEVALSRIHGRRVPVTCASRTDSGVHAEGQVVHFRSDSRLSNPVMKKALNCHLPEAIAVKSLQTMPKEFHARFHAKLKHYKYVLYTGETKPIFDNKFVTWYRCKLNLTHMRRAARFLIGQHDFTSFASADDMRANKCKRLVSIRIKQSGDYVEFNFLGQGFLRNMVRIMVGSLMDVGLGKLAAHDIKRILEACDRQEASPTASAKGLRLIKVYY